MYILRSPDRIESHQIISRCGEVEIVKEFIATSAGRIFLKDIHTIAISLKKIADTISKEEEQQKEDDKDEKDE